MHMTFQDKLRLHLAEKDVTWTFDGSRALASWNEAGPCLLLGVPGPLAAAAVLDAYVLAQAQQAHLTVVHEGPATPVALRAATRFGVTVLDATHWPLPAPVEPETPALVEAPVEEPPAAAVSEVVPEIEAPSFVEPAPEALFAVEAVAAAVEPPLLLAAPEAPLLLPEHVEPAVVEAPVLEMPPVEEPTVEAAPESVPEVVEPGAVAPETTPADIAVEAPLPEPVTETPVEAVAEPVAAEPAFEPASEPEALTFPEPQPEPASEPESGYIEATSYPTPVLAHASADAPMPWDTPAYAAEPAAVLAVTRDELEALPWHAPSEEEEEHVELLPGNARPRQFVDHPTSTAAGWGLPWPRPVAPADGLAIVDPRIWKTAERIHAVREDLDKVGAPSFGAAPSEGSAWLKRISQFAP